MTERANSGGGRGMKMMRQPDHPGVRTQPQVAIADLRRTPGGPIGLIHNIQTAERTDERSYVSGGCARVQSAPYWGSFDLDATLGRETNERQPRRTTADNHDQCRQPRGERR